jgi:diguanylate cyclase (GGDEF)-like protein
MIGSRFPRLLLHAAALGIAGAAIMLSLFYGQYWRLANQIESASYEEHRSLLEASFERRSRADLHAIADRLPDDLTDIDARTIQQQLNRALTMHPERTIQQQLNRALTMHPELNGIRLASAAGSTWSSGNYPQDVIVTETTWLEEQLLLTHPVARDGKVIGVLAGSFELDTLESRRVSYIWIGGGTLAVLILSLVVVWLITRGQTKRIRQLKAQAEKFRDADFGDPLPETGGDELGALASVFNDMRDRLRTTTHSRDYVDSILSGMNEAIIVTSDDGQKKNQSLAHDAPSRLPREAVFESKYGESIPVSYTCSIVESDGGDTSNRIYAAQNITERRRAEKRIRYLARIDALTKIPNRMQFQHLLQRNIARARRAGKPLCLFYVDIDHFKEINDTFGHLAGDTTLETVAERLSAALPDHSIIGRLAGDEFAITIDSLGPDTAGQKKTSQLAQKLLDRLADPFFVQGHEVFMTASMGIAYYPNDAPNVIDLIRNADAALYSAKKSGGNVFAFYKPVMNEASVERLMTTRAN